MEHVHVVVVMVRNSALTQEVEGCHLIIVRLIWVNLKLLNQELEHELVGLCDDEVHCIPLTLGSILTEHLLPIELVIHVLSFILAYLWDIVVKASRHCGHSSLLASHLSAASVSHLFELLFPRHNLLLFLSHLSKDDGLLLSCSDCNKLQSLLLFQVSVALEFAHQGVRVGACSNEDLENVNEGFYDDLVKELFTHGHLLLLTKSWVIIVEVLLIAELVEYILISQLVHGSVGTMDEGLLVHLV